MKSSTISPQGYKVTVEMYRKTIGESFDGQVAAGPWHLEGIVEGYPPRNLSRLFFTGKPFNIFLFDNRLSGPVLLHCYSGNVGHFISKGPIRQGKV